MSYMLYIYQIYVKREKRSPMIDNEIKVRYKTVWGKDRFQPCNETAKIFSQIAKKKTLTREQLILCRSLGFDILIPNMDVDKYLSDNFER